MQLAQLLLVHWRGGLGQQALGTLGLGEGDHVADRLGSGHQRDEAVQAEGQTTVWRRAVLQGVEQVAKLGLRVFRRDLERSEHLALHISTVDTHRAAAQLPAVEHHVVGLGKALARIGVHEVLVAILGAGEGVVHSCPAVFFLVVLEHGEVHHPQGSPTVFEETVLLAEFAVADLDAQCTDGVVDDLFLVGTEEQQVAILRARALEHFSQRSVVNVLDDGRLQAVTALGQFIDTDVSQTLGTVDLDELGVGIDLATADAAVFGRATGHAQGHHAATLHVRGAREHLEVHVLHHVGQLGEFELHAQVRLVGAKTVSGFLVRHDRELTQVHTQLGSGTPR